MEYEVLPFRLYAYIQDKIEYKGFIANIGIRTDYSDGNTQKFELTNFDDLFKQGLGNGLEISANKQPSKPIFAFSPRLGISHPITERQNYFLIMVTFIPNHLHHIVSGYSVKVMVW